uniref:Uncharacterized protein n=1 Tax=Tanacetum cinerariifolium TaxID=118510 RepID=A0A699IYE7_TANCI|nr:hypothetical protein [Tanacetum cinerariifolium]
MVYSIDSYAHVWEWWVIGGKCVGDKKAVWMTHGDEAVKLSNGVQAVLSRIRTNNVNNDVAPRYAMEQLCDKVPIMIISWIRFQRMQILESNIIIHESQHDKVGTNVTLMSNAQPNSRHDPRRRAQEISQSKQVHTLRLFVFDKLTHPFIRYHLPRCKMIS